MLPLLLIGIATISDVLVAKEEENNFSEMANTHEQFLLFEKRISVPLYKRRQLIGSRKALQKKITEYFSINHQSLHPKFYIQGSYKMGTMILDSNDTYDVDLGVYFLQKLDIVPTTLQGWVLEAVKNKTRTGAQHREKCIRVLYKGDFDIDLPVYYMERGGIHPHLATKKGWVSSDPKELCDWFESKKDADGQLVRLVKYFKAWSNNQTGKMPSGIAFSVWVTNNFKPNGRDDIAFLETAIEIKNTFFWRTKCVNPACPKDNFTQKLTEQQINNFNSCLNRLIKNGKVALKQKDINEAIKIWQRQFGKKFT